jgi:predicted HicB family RNase H-like nuclease
MAATPTLSTTRKQNSFVGEFLGRLQGQASMDSVRMSFAVGSKSHWMSFFGVCQEQGIEPRRHFSGKFDLQISPERHEKMAMTAQLQGKNVSTRSLRKRSREPSRPEEADFHRLECVSVIQERL